MEQDLKEFSTILCDALIMTTEQPFGWYQSSKQDILTSRGRDKCFRDINMAIVAATSRFPLVVYGAHY